MQKMRSSTFIAGNLHGGVREGGGAAALLPPPLLGCCSSDLPGYNELMEKFLRCTWLSGQLPRVAHEHALVTGDVRLRDKALACPCLSKGTKQLSEQFKI
jgi:hypothetical protein